MYVLLYIFVCQLSSAADSENGRKYEVRCGTWWWPCAAMVAIGWAVAEIRRWMVAVVLSFARLKGGIGAARWLPQCRQDNNDIYSCPNHGSESVRSPAGGL